MLYHLFDWLGADVTGSGRLQLHLVPCGDGRVRFAVDLAVVGQGHHQPAPQRMQVGETVRDLGLEGQLQKQGTPTMGGLIILSATIIPTLLFAKLDNIYIILLLVSTVWLGTIGFIDDYIKVFKKDKRGLAGKFKVVGQVGIGHHHRCHRVFPSFEIRTKVEVSASNCPEQDPAELK
jgi:phospho-N-acetylmuramoyl-pentapeptide-transferase